MVDVHVKVHSIDGTSEPAPCSRFCVCPGERQGADGPGLKGLREQEVEVSAEDADKDKDFNVTDLHKCKVTM